jgi:rhamnosyltransferase
MEVLVSIVVPTRNSLPLIRRLVDAILNQNVPFRFELVFMENSSDDGTVEYLHAIPHPDKRIITIAKGQFSHSGTRMLAAEAAAGQIMVYFTDDAVPIGQQFLANLTAPVRAGLAAAAYGVHQINHEWHDPVDAFLHNEWYERYDDIVEPISQFCWDKFTPDVRRRLSNFDNCASCIHRETLLKMRFPSVAYGEDMFFARQLILNGFRVAQVKDAKFYHWHKVKFGYMFRRMCVDAHLSLQHFDIRYVNRLRGVIKAIVIRTLHRTYIAFFKIRMPLSRKIYWSCYNARVLSADFLGKYCGTIDADMAARRFSPLKKKLFHLKTRILEETEQRSIGRH